MIPDAAWFTETYVPTVAKRGAAVIKARSASGRLSGQRHHQQRPLDPVAHPQGDWFQRGGPPTAATPSPPDDLQLPLVSWGMPPGRRPRAADRRRRPATTRRLGAELVSERDAVKGFLGGMKPVLC